MAESEDAFIPRYRGRLREGEEVERHFIVRHKSVATSRQGNLYLIVRLQDKDGEILGRLWERIEEIAPRFSLDDVVRIRGKAVRFQNEIQLLLSEIEPASPEAWRIEDLLPATQRDIEAMWRDLGHIVRRIGDFYLRRLLSLFLDDPAIVAAFKTSPATRQGAHARYGGLLEQTLSLARLVLFLREQYEGIHHELLLCGVILHGIARLRLFDGGNTFRSSNAEALLGPAVLEITAIEEKIREIPGFPEELALLLEHLLLSQPSGDPTKPSISPQTLEAEILCAIHALDTRIDGLHSFLETEMGERGGWTRKHPHLGRTYYRTSYPAEEHWSVARRSSPPSTSPESAPIGPLFDGKKR
ncbi:MAG: hypothetical protein D6812_04240 [Deltaproteobacteria bacterium]|nr:MAG: hypothetical protein D6812_04240 [Deltaproteobacteria bacterium]